MKVRCYKDTEGYTAVIFKTGFRREPYLLVNFYTDWASEFSCGTLDEAEALLRCTGGTWTEMPVMRNHDEAVA